MFSMPSRRFALTQSIYDLASLLLRVELCPVSYSGGCGFRQVRGSSTIPKFDLTDLTHPHTWYPNARKKRRNITLHVGPTNSGKTYHALKQLESSSTGIYCGPLRLLAWEVSKRLNKANVPCDLITGQEREIIDGSRHKAVTVEMADLTCDYCCAVIDEIQMVACKKRGFSFTRALLGISADELHLCGDAAAVPLIAEIIRATGDIIEIKHYDRLSPLIPLEVPLGSFSNVRRGDCIVTFSRHEIYRLKREIESHGKHLCSIVYGSLPPETRTRQATMFNDASSEFDILVASDAIGMGLNLNICRVIFSTLKKFDGAYVRDLTIPEIKQIAGYMEEQRQLLYTFLTLITNSFFAVGSEIKCISCFHHTYPPQPIPKTGGRAGRYGSKFPHGEVTCIYAADLPRLRSSLKSPSPDLEQAGLFPTADSLFLYSRLHPQMGFRDTLERFLDDAKLSANYFMADCEDVLKVAAIVDELPLTLQDKYLFSICPIDVNDSISSQGLIQFAHAYAKRGSVRLKEIFTPETVQIPKSDSALKELESIHKVLDLYVWLSFRLEGSFPDQELATNQKSICSLLIEEFLERLGWRKQRMKRLSHPNLELLTC